MVINRYTCVEMVHYYNQYLHRFYQITAGYYVSFTDCIFWNNTLYLIIYNHYKKYSFYSLNLPAKKIVEWFHIEISQKEERIEYERLKAERSKAEEKELQREKDFDELVKEIPTFDVVESEKERLEKEAEWEKKICLEFSNENTEDL